VIPSVFTTALIDVYPAPISHAPAIRRNAPLLCAHPFDCQNGMQFDATPGLTDLKVVHIEESNTCDADDDSPKIAQVLCL